MYLAATSLRLNTSLFIGGLSTANASAIVDISSTTKGFLPPRQTTTQINAITTPAEALMVYDLTLHKYKFWNGSAYEVITSA